MILDSGGVVLRVRVGREGRARYWDIALLWQQVLKFVLSSVVSAQVSPYPHSIFIEGRATFAHHYATTVSLLIILLCGTSRLAMILAQNVAFTYVTPWKSPTYPLLSSVAMALLFWNALVFGKATMYIGRLVQDVHVHVHDPTS